MAIQIFKTVSQALFGRKPRLGKQYPKGGVRVIHDSMKNCIVTVEVIGKPFGFKNGLPLPGHKHHTCPTCQVEHRYKTLHLMLDDAGGTIISRGVLEELEAGGMPNFQIESEVDNPPPITVGFNHSTKQMEVVRELPKVVTYGHG